MSIPKAAGLICYKDAADNAKARTLFEDAFLLPDTYEKFLIRFAESWKAAKDMGWIPVKAELEPVAFTRWCRSRGLNVNAHGRTEWGNMKALEYLKEKGFIK